MKKILLIFILSFLFRINAFSQSHVIPQLGHQESIIHAKFSKDGKWLATGGRDRVILLWDMQKGLHWPLEGHSFVVTGIDFNDDNTLLATSDGRGKIFIWDIDSKSILYQKDLKRDVNDIHFLPNGKGLLYSDDVVNIWNYKSSQVQKTTMKKSEGGMSSVSISPDGKYRMHTQKKMDYINSNFVTNYTFTLHDISQSKEIYRNDLKQFGNKWIVNAISSDGKLIALGNEFKIVVLKLDNGQLVKQFNKASDIENLYFTKGDQQVIASYTDGYILVGNLQTGKTESIGGVVGHDVPAGKMAYDATNDIIAGITKETEIVFYDLENRQQIKTFSPGASEIAGLYWNETKRELYTLMNSSVITWDLNALNISEAIYSSKNNSGSSIGVIAGKTKQIYEEPYKYFNKTGYLPKYPDGESRKHHLKRTAVGTSKFGFKVYDKSTGNEIASFPSAIYIIGTAISQDGTKVFASSVNKIDVYSLPDKKLVKSILYETGAPSVMKVTPDGKHLVVGKTAETVWFGDTEKPLEFDIDIYDIGTLNLSGKLKGHYSSITGLDFTQNGSLLFSGAMDGTIRIWDLKTKKQKVLLHGNATDHYFIVSEDGYYSMAKKAIENIAYGDQNNIYPAAQFEIKLNRPDKVAEAIGFTQPSLLEAYQKAYQKRIKQLGVSDDKIDLNNLPTIQANIDHLPRTTGEKNISFSIQASDQKVNLTQLKILVNNVPVIEDKSTSVKSSRTIKKNINLTLSSGMNRVSVSVINEQGLESAPATFEITCTQKAKPNLYLFNIGVSKFADSEYNLTYAAKDAKDLAAFFETRKADYGQVFVKSFTDIAATKSNILASSDFFSNANEDDEVIIFVASHGLLDENLDYYIATSDMVFDNPSFLGLKYTEIESFFKNTKARNRLLMIDACHSGEIDKEGTEVVAGTKSTNTSGVKSRGFKTVKSSNDLGLKNSFELMKEIFADMRNGTGATVISSASGTEFALESDQWKNGVFTYSVLNGMTSKTADMNRDAYISVSELKEYVFDEVGKLTNGLQHPTSRVENIQNDFVVTSTTEAHVVKYEVKGKWVNEYNYYKDKRKKYIEVVTNGVDLDIYTTSMEDYSKKWYMNKGPIRYTKIAPNQYKNVSGAIIEMRGKDQLVMKDMYGNSDFDAIYTPTATINTNTDNSIFGVWYRSDKKTDSSGKVSSVKITSLSDMQLEVWFSVSGSTYKYDKKSDSEYEFKLGASSYKLAVNADGSLTINNYNFSR
ncbi:caspase family protein [Reichenbachiella sp. MALMAid0571]|uniref:caspase family protein n=1 Tax=Reichenbachiella sp. MALMAid0571 TaxID=3143939 RepID=UPI0032DE5C7B